MSGAALLIGNARYGRDSVFRPLITPRNDIENLSERFNTLGFETYVVADADRAMMGSVIAQFRNVVSRLPERAPAIVYFAGHGVQHKGENYLAPIDAGGTSEQEVLWSCLRLSEIMDTLCWREDQQKLVVLDACRSHHVPSTTRDGVTGLAGEAPNPYGQVHETHVLYATGPGQLALDGAEYGASPLCLALLDALADPSAPISLLCARVTEFVFRHTAKAQKPWGLGNLCHLWPLVTERNGGTPVIQPSSSPLLDTADRYVSDRGHLIHKLKAKDATDRWAYYFVLVEPEKEAGFLSAIGGEGTLDLEDYGQVVASSYGEEPTPPVKTYLKEKYGFEV